jgi:hypothetical protein
VLILICRLFAKGFDQRPPPQIRLDDVLVALGEASGGGGSPINREATPK